MIEKHTLKRANIIQPVYKYAEKYCIERRIDKSKIKIVYNRVYSSDFFPGSSSVRRKKTESIRIIAVGNLDHRKGQRTLLEAVSQLSCDFHLTLVGKGKDELYLLSLIDRYKLQTKVRLINSVQNANLQSVYVDHDIFALPIQYGGICIPAIEAAACGLAVIYPTAKDNSQPELISEFWYSVENTPQGFAAAINELSKERKLLDKMKARALLGYSALSGEEMELKEISNYKLLVT